MAKLPHEPIDHSPNDEGESPVEAGETPPRLRPLFRLDPGWLFLSAGVAMIASTILIPTIEDLQRARWNRDRAYSVEHYRQTRLENHARYLDALRAEDRTLVLSLAVTQLNLAPADKLAMIDASQDGLPDASVFESLEPTLKHIPPPVESESLLARLSRHETRRMWVIAGGALAILIGLLPPSRPRA